MKRSYDIIAPVYDKIATLIFGKELRKAQTYFLHQIPSSSQVLIAGGGTGWILEEITAIYPKGLYIDYVDVSDKMIEIARQRNVGGNKVNYVHQSILHFISNRKYDVIITPFFFDNFAQQTAKQAFAILHGLLQTNGLWIYTDFQIQNASPIWQKILLRMMYSFFRLTADIEAKRLPDITSYFDKHHYQLVETKTFMRQFIFTSLYKKLL